MPPFQRKLVPIKPGEERPRDLLVGDVNGMRLETDDEFSERIKRETAIETARRSGLAGVDGYIDPNWPGRYFR